jgi:hypothetical protein
MPSLARRRSRHQRICAWCRPAGGAGAAGTTRSMRAPWTFPPSSGWWRPLRWPRRRRGMPSTPASGRAATPRRVLSAGMTRIPLGTPTDSPSWQARSIRGWSRCPAGVPAGRRHRACGACGRGSTPPRWRPTGSVPGCAKHLLLPLLAPARAPPAHQQLRRGRRRGPTQPGVSGGTRGPVGPPARGSLLLC